MTYTLSGPLKRKWLPAGALAVVAVLVLAFSAPPSEGLSFTSPVYAIPTVVPIPAPFGGWVWGDLNGPACLDHAVAIGVKWIRWPLLWSWVESTPDQYDWSYVDLQITNAHQAGISLIANIRDNPPWAATYRQGPLNNNADLAEFARAAVERYDGDGINDAPGSPVVRYWQFYNEVDNSWETFAQQGTHGFWGYDGAGYAQLLAAVYPEIKQASPEAQVVIGGLAYDAFVEDGGPFVRRFLDDVLQNNGGQYFDVMAFHYYWEQKWDAYGPGIAGKTAYLRNKLAEYGLSKPMICTETGRHVHDWSNEERQSLFLVKTFVQGIAADLEAIVWFTLVDQPEYDFGLLKQDMSPRSSYYAYRTLTNQLSNAHYERRLIDEETGSPDIEGYLFQAPGVVIRVVWTNGEKIITMSIPASQIDQVDKYGSVISPLYDATDGRMDGIVSINVGPSPVYLIIRN